MSADVALLVVSLAGLTIAGDQFVVGVARLASVLRIRPTIVGAVVGGIGTSLPELLVSGVATARGELQLAVGNLVGSIIANISLGLGIAAMVAPIRVDSIAIRREAPISVGSVLLFGLLTMRTPSANTGVVFSLALVAALVLLLLNARIVPGRDELAVEVVDFFGEPRRHRTGREVARTLLSMTGMLLAAEVLVRSGADLAGRLGVGQGQVGLTLVAIGTSAPLIASNVQAARRGDHDLVVGNTVGGNLFIALGGGLVVGFLSEGSGPGIGVAPLWLMAALAVGSWGFMARGSRVSRWEAMVLLVTYAAALPLVAR